MSLRSIEMERGEDLVDEDCLEGEKVSTSKASVEP
jgi:hypothetical protein